MTHTLFDCRLQAAWTIMIRLRSHLAVSSINQSYQPNLTFWNIESIMKQMQASIESKPKNEDILNAVLPPREWIEYGKWKTLEIKVISLWSPLFKFEWTVTDTNFHRQALRPVRQPPASFKSWCRSTQRDARLEAHGKTSTWEWHLPCQRRALLAVLRWDHSPDLP